jgi:hypothetical protein
VGVTLQVRVVDVEAPARLVVWSKGNREKPLLAAGPDLARDIQERLAKEASLFDDPDPAHLLDDVETIGLTWSGGEIDGRLEPTRHMPQLDAKRAARDPPRARSRIRGRRGAGDRVRVRCRPIIVAEGASGQQQDDRGEKKDAHGPNTPTCGSPFLSQRGVKTLS